MIIRRLECIAVDMELQEPYSVAYGDFHHITNVFIRAETDDGLIGWGCGAPDEEVTGETGPSLEAAFEQIIEPILHGADLRRYIAVHEALREPLKGQPSAHAMADMLVYDLLAQRARLPLYQWLGGYRSAMPTSITIGLMGVEQTLQKAREYLEQGFFILKIKGGLDLDEDIERMRRLRQFVPPGVALRFDANQGYHVDQALRFLDATRELDIELLEQPTPRQEEESLGRLSRASRIPVMADESLLNLEDAFRMLSNQHSDLINIKLQKVGGITESLHINSVARSAGVQAMLGCMDESALGIAAGLHVALARPNIAYADLDGHFDILNDPFDGLIPCRDGILYPPEHPGLGLRPGFDPEFAAGP